MAIKALSELIAVTLLLAGTVPVIAQDVSSAAAQHAPRSVGVGGGFISLGVASVAVGDLNRQLGDLGYSSFKGAMVNIGVGGFASLPRIVLGGEGHMLLSPGEQRSASGMEARISGGYGLLTVGHPVFSSGRTTVLPMAGLGIGGLGVAVHEPADGTFDEVLINPPARTQLYSAALLLDASAALVHQFRVGGRDRPGGMLLAIRFGYTHAPQKSEWRSRVGGTVSDAPAAAIQGVYVRVVLGGWGTGRPTRGG